MPHYSPRNRAQNSIFRSAFFIARRVLFMRSRSNVAILVALVMEYASTRREWRENRKQYQTVIKHASEIRDRAFPRTKITRPPPKKKKAQYNGDALMEIAITSGDAAISLVLKTGCRDWRVRKKISFDPRRVNSAPSYWMLHIEISQRSTNESAIRGVERLCRATDGRQFAQRAANYYVEHCLECVTVTSYVNHSRAAPLTNSRETREEARRSTPVALTTRNQLSGETGIDRDVLHARNNRSEMRSDKFRARCKHLPTTNEPIFRRRWISKNRCKYHRQHAAPPKRIVLRFILLQVENCVKFEFFTLQLFGTSRTNLKR